MKELLYLKDNQLKHLIEKLFISYRETFSDSKKILDKFENWENMFAVFGGIAEVEKDSVQL